MRRNRPWLLVIVLLGGVGVGSLLTQQLQSRHPAQTPPGDAVVQALAPSVARAAPLPFPDSSSIADVAERVTPSVVSVFSEKELRLPEGMVHPFADPFFRRFFGEPPQGGQDRPMPKQQGLGSGVIVSSDGVILTNNHVVEAADTIRVGFSDGSDAEAEVVGTDPKSDLAVIRVKKKGLPSIAVADSAKARVGDVVLAIGNPFGLTHSVTLGIISATGRANMGITDYENFLQTDAAINPGNSGGALVNLRGELVGINTAIASRSGGYQGIGFAIPSSMAVGIKDSILTNGRVIRGWLGVAIQNLTDELAETMSLKKKAGVLVSDVVKGSPADKAGVARGDVVTQVDGIDTNDASQLRNLIAQKGKNVRTRLSVLRDGKPRSIDVMLGELPDDDGTPVASKPGETQGESGLFEGVTVRNLDGPTRKRANLPPEVKGVLVSEVSRTSPAAEYGLRPGDVIVEINRTPTPDVGSFKKAAAKQGKRVLLLVYRDGSTIFLAIRR
ncbi:MAG: DegQ family serine endoprotease [Pseudomonadota bacterium]